MMVNSQILLTNCHYILFFIVELVFSMLVSYKSNASITLQCQLRSNSEDKVDKTAIDSTEK